MGAHRDADADVSGSIISGGNRIIEAVKLCSVPSD